MATRSYHAILGVSPEETERGTVSDPVSVLADRHAIRPSFESLYDRFLRNFTGVHVPKAERLEGLNFDVLLTPEEAMRGGILPVSVPVFRACASCGGSGTDWVLPCSACRGRGLVEQSETVDIWIPPDVASGTVIDVSLHRVGIHNLYLQLHTLIADDALSSRPW